jgi:hypothetical protein
MTAHNNMTFSYLTLPLNLNYDLTIFLVFRQFFVFLHNSNFSHTRYYSQVNRLDPGHVVAIDFFVDMTLLDPIEAEVVNMDDMMDKVDMVDEVEYVDLGYILIGPDLP